MSANGAVIVSTFAGVPIVTLAHELGHAAAGLKFTKNPVLVRVGRADAAVKLRIGRLLIVFSPFGAGGFCRTQGRITRRQALMRALAGPAVNLLLAPLLWVAGQAASDAARPVLFTLAALNGLMLLNLIPHRTQWNPITKGLPSDGLQALCLLRNRPLPPPRPPHPAVGMRTPLSGYQIAVTLASVPVWVLITAHHLNQTALCIWLPLVLQGALGGSGPSTKTQTQPAKPSTQTGLAPRRSAMKTCPKCGAQVRSAARLCFCYHAFG
jgi:hypothetical protein